MELTFDSQIAFFVANCNPVRYTSGEALPLSSRFLASLTWRLCISFALHGLDNPSSWNNKHGGVLISLVIIENNEIR